MNPASARSIDTTRGQNGEVWTQNINTFSTFEPHLDFHARVMSVCPPVSHPYAHPPYIQPLMKCLGHGYLSCAGYARRTKS